MSDNSESLDKLQADREAWIREVDRWYDLLRPKLSHIDPHDLRMILRSYLQPESIPRCWLLRKPKDGHYGL